MSIGKIICDNVQLDLDANIQVPITYSIADKKTPQDLRRSSSKTVKLRGTKTNMIFFSSTYQLSLGAITDTAVVGFDFDPTIRVPVKYFRGCDLQFDGMLQLLAVDIDENGEYWFNCCMFSGLVDLYKALGEIKLADLGWSEYNHQLDFDQIQNSWDTSVTLNGSEAFNFTSGVPDGWGYLYAPVDYGYEPNPRDIKDNNLFVGVYWREIFTKCFALAGQTITGSWIDSERLRRMVIGWSGGDKVALSPAEVAAREVDFDATGEYENTITFNQHFVIPPGFDISFPNGYHQYKYSSNQYLTLGQSFWSTITENTDTLTQLDPATGELQVARTGVYRLQLGGSFDSVKQLVGTQLGFNSTANLQIQLIKNGAPVTSLVNAGLVDATTTTFGYDGNISLVTGDILTFRFYVSFNATVNSEELPANAPYFDLAFTDNSDWTFNLSSVEAPLVNGDTVDVARFLPDMKCSDFIKGAINAFNLYIDDPNVDGEVEILPETEFYTQTNVFDDWSKKIDYKLTRNIAPSSNIEGKVYAFKFLQDDDYWNNFYRTRYNIGYGDYNYQVPSTFLDGTRMYELPFAQTVPVQLPGCNIILPSIIQVDDSTGLVKPYKGKPRVFYYQGLVSSDSWVLRNSAVTTTSTTFTEYPALSHQDSYTLPDFDFAFAPPQMIQFNGDTTGVNLFSEYHYQPIRELTGKDSKIYTVYAWLDNTDIERNSFKRLVMINGVLYRRNVIKDYQANHNEPTLCELIKVVAADKRRALRPYARPGYQEGEEVIIGGKVAGPGVPADTSEELDNGGINSIAETAEVIYGGTK